MLKIMKLFYVAIIISSGTSNAQVPDASQRWLIPVHKEDERVGDALIFVSDTHYAEHCGHTLSNSSWGYPYGDVTLPPIQIEFLTSIFVTSGCALISEIGSDTKDGVLTLTLTVREAQRGCAIGPYQILFGGNYNCKKNFQDCPTLKKIVIKPGPNSHFACNDSEIVFEAKN